MDVSPVHQYRFVLAFLALGLVFGVLSVIVPLFVAPRGKGEDSLKTYESGIIPQRGAWRQFSLAYYLYALLYLAVAVDVIYLFPVAVVFRAMHSLAVVATGYGMAQRKLGTVSVIGPVRMDYAVAIDTVRAVARQLSRFVQDVY